MTDRGTFRGFYVGQREPTCVHDHNQPAIMCQVCQHDPKVKAWHFAAHHYAETGQVLPAEAALAAVSS